MREGGVRRDVRSDRIVDGEGQRRIREEIFQWSLQPCCSLDYSHILLTIFLYFTTSSDSLFIS